MAPKARLKKDSFPVGEGLTGYLGRYRRATALPLSYWDLLDYRETYPILDRDGRDTMWLGVLYDRLRMEEVHRSLAKVYVLLKAGGDESVMEHLHIDRIDYCTFGNTNPFRVRVVNNFNDNYDYYYLKRADASRIYGLELEELTSPNSMNFLVDRDTVIEEHIAGIPGDAFIETRLHWATLNRVRLAKEFIKFNERCFVRLLGDMRSYNYVVDITPDFEDEQYRVRCIDFDQQAFEGRMALYFAHHFKENREIVDLCTALLNTETIHQYQREERVLIQRRIKYSGAQIEDLRRVMESDTISRPEHLERLRRELADYHGDRTFLDAASMGQLVFQHLETSLRG